MERRLGTVTKVCASLLMGWLAFALSQVAIGVDDLYNLRIFWSLIFPLILSMGWGWRYALISGLPGLAAFVPFYATPEQGWVNVMTSALLLIWLVFMGLCSQWQRAKGKRHYWSYFFLCLFLLLLALCYLTLYERLLHCNPPFWMDGGAKRFTAYSTIGVMTINLGISLFLFAAVANVLLTLPFVRKAMGLEESKGGKYNNLIFASTLGIMAILIVSDNMLNHFFLNHMGTYASLFGSNTGGMIKISLVAFVAFLACDITIMTSENYVEAELRMRLSRARYKRIFENILDLYIELDQDGRIVEASPAIKPILDYTPEEALGGRLASIVARPEEAAALMRRLEEKSAILNYKLRVYNSKGETMTLLLNMRRLADPDGTKRTVVLARDITAYERSENRRIELSSNLEAVFESCDEMIWSVSGEDFALITYNTAMKNYFSDVMGIAVSLGMPLEEMCLPERLEIWRNYYRRVLFIGEFRVEHQMLKDKRYFEITFYPIRCRDGRANISVFAKDVTDRRNKIRQIEHLNEELEQRVLERTQELQAANTELESFSYTISHEFKTPIRAIEAYVDLMGDENLARLDEEGQQSIQGILRVCRETIQMTQRLLEHCRANYKNLELELIDMGALVMAAFEEVKLTADRTIYLNLAPLPNIIGDHSLIRQVVYNLLANSVKFSKGKNIIRIDVWATVAEKTAAISFKDYGVGIDMRYAQKLGTLFEKLHSEDYEGSGVGLAMAQKTMLRHHGDIKIISAPDEGCTVSLIFKK